MIFELGNTLVSEDILKEEFVCNISKCKGQCCVDGDAGAPLEEEEINILKNIYSEVKPYLRKEGIDAIEKQGEYVVDYDGEYVTPLVKGKECAYVIFDENGITKCGIEKAFEEKKVDFQKPISCHLYPIRVKKYKDFEGINYDVWDICSDACTLGQELKVPVYKFTKNALIRKYGENWYKELEQVARLYKEDKN